MLKKLREFEDFHCTPKSTITFKKKLRDNFFMDHFEKLPQLLWPPESRGILHQNIQTMFKQTEKHGSFSLFWLGPEKLIFLSSHYFCTNLTTLDSVSLQLSKLLIVKTEDALQIINIK